MGNMSKIASGAVSKSGFVDIKKTKGGGGVVVVDSHALKHKLIKLAVQGSS